MAKNMSLIEVQDQISKNIAENSSDIIENENTAAKEVEGEDINESSDNIACNHILPIDNSNPIANGPCPNDNEDTANESINMIHINKIPEKTVHSARNNKGSISKINEINDDDDTDVSTKKGDTLNNDNDATNIVNPLNIDSVPSNGSDVVNHEPSVFNNVNSINIEIENQSACDALNEENLYVFKDQNRKDSDRVDGNDDGTSNVLTEHTPENDTNTKKSFMRDDDSDDLTSRLESTGNKNDDEEKRDVVNREEKATPTESDCLRDEKAGAYEQVVETSSKHDDDEQISDTKEALLATDNIVCSENLTNENEDENMMETIDKEPNNTGFPIPITTDVNDSHNPADILTNDIEIIKKDICMDVDNVDEIVFPVTNIQIDTKKVVDISMDERLCESKINDVGESHRFKGFDVDSTEIKSISNNDKINENNDNMDLDNAERNIVMNAITDSDVHTAAKMTTNPKEKYTSKASFTKNTNDEPIIQIDTIINRTNENTYEDIEANQKYNLDNVSISAIPTGLNNSESTKSSLNMNEASDLIQTVLENNTGLSNNLQILSDEEDGCRTLIVTSPQDKPIIDTPQEPKEIAHLKVDDEVMVIDADDKNNGKKEIAPEFADKDGTAPDVIDESATENDDVFELNMSEETHIKSNEDDSKAENQKDQMEMSDTAAAPIKLKENSLIALNFMKNVKVKMCDMTRTDLEDFCLLKIVEGLVDRSSLSEIKGKIKTLMETVDDWKKKAMVLNKQNKDLKVILTNVQEEQNKRSGELITPLRITRSVGMQVLMTNNKITQASNSNRGQKRISTPNSNAVTKNVVIKNNIQQKNVMKPPIPVPRLVPALNNSPSKSNTRPQLQNSTITSSCGTGKLSSSPNGLRFNATQNKPAEKRSLGSVSIDLTDDEPPAKLMANNKGTPPVRIASKGANQNSTNPRQVYIPINGSPVNGNIRPGQTITFSASVRPRAPNPTIRSANSRANCRVNPIRHPAPLPHAYRQAQPLNWKSLPPAPDLKISKVENGIVISWKMENGFNEDFCEEIASYQLYAYQETSGAPSTMLWKKIGDVKALPLPMACTLTQFMSGYKYYFAVRAVDVRSRLGPFSLPGSILLLHK